MKQTLLIASMIACLPSFAGEPTIFPSWQAFFTDVAKRLDIEQTPENVFALATDSDKELLPNDRSFVLVKGNLYYLRQGLLINRLRGASGNGPFFLVKRTEAGFRLVGTMEGVACKDLEWNSRAGVVYRQFECRWNLGGGNVRISRFETDSNSLKLVDSRESKNATSGKP